MVRETSPKKETVRGRAPWATNCPTAELPAPRARSCHRRRCTSLPRQRHRGRAVGNGAHFCDTKRASQRLLFFILKRISLYKVGRNPLIPQLCTGVKHGQVPSSVRVCVWLCCSRLLECPSVCDSMRLLVRSFVHFIWLLSSLSTRAQKGMRLGKGREINDKEKRQTHKQTNGQTNERTNKQTKKKERRTKQEQQTHTHTQSNQNN